MTNLKISFLFTKKNRNKANMIKTVSHVFNGLLYFFV